MNAWLSQINKHGINFGKDQKASIYMKMRKSIKANTEKNILNDSITKILNLMGYSW